MGDLNQVRGWAKKLSSHRRTIHGASTFNELIFRNRQKDSDVVYERLDRVLASSSWVAAFSHFSLATLPIHRSDHSPLLLDTSQVDLQGKKCGKFEVVWLTDPSTQDLINKVWKMTLQGSALFLLVQRQAIILKHLKNRNTLSYKSMQGPHFYEQDLRLQLNILLQKQELYWAQRSKQHWMNLGDQNTNFFHRMAF
ncbi:hypothetical protein CsSME_00046839 [Camellia sinensis var. sinensis]